MHKNSSAIAGVFTSHGLRCTRQRVALYTALQGIDSHPTADELFQLVSQNEPSISLATVYNTLEAFCEAGLARKLPGCGQNGSARYDADHGPHLHIRCRQTGRLADVPGDLSQLFLNHIPSHTLEQLEEQLGFKIDHIQIELVGQYES